MGAPGLAANADFPDKYLVRGGLWRDGDSPRVDWRALFPDRAAEVRRGRVTVRLPRHLAGQVGEYDSSSAPASARQVDDRTVEFTTRQVLMPGKELRVKVAFPGASFPADALRGDGGFPWKYLLIAIAVLVGIGLMGFLALKMGIRAWRESGLRLAPSGYWG